METQPISFRKFPKELYHQVKVEAVIRNTTVTGLFIEAIRELLKKRKSNGRKV